MNVATGAAASDALMIRRAGPEEAELLSALAMRSKAYWGYPPTFMAACRDELSITAGDIATGSIAYIVAEKTGKVTGFYGLQRSSGDRYELDALYVDPAYIGTGIGRALIRHALHAVDAAGGRVLVVQGDPNAEGFYRAAGGEYAGRRESMSIPGRFLPVFEIPVPVPPAPRRGAG